MAKTQNKPANPDNQKVGSTIVTTEFRDKDDFDKVYEVGQDVSDLEPKRIAELVAAGVVETYEEPVKTADNPPAP